MGAEHQAQEAVPSASASPGPLRVAVVDSVDELERIAPEWDRLAADAACPAALSGWQLAWWRHQAPAGAQLRTVVIRDAADRLVGLAPFAAEPATARTTVYRLLAAPITHRVEPLAHPDARADVAHLVGVALREAEPAPDCVLFDSAPTDGLWLDALRRGWPGRVRPWTLSDREQPAPFSDLRHADYDAWLAARSSNFRQQARRFRRRLERAGGTVRMTATEAQLDRDVDAFTRLHLARWDDRGGSSLTPGIAAMLKDAGRALLASGAFRLWIVERDGEPIGAQLFLAAGRHVLYWNGGFEAGAAELRPALVGILAAVEDCIERGADRLDLGGGAHDYKLRMADGDAPLTSAALVPMGPGYVRGRLALAPRQARVTARRIVHALPPDVQERVLALRRRDGA